MKCNLKFLHLSVEIAEAEVEITISRMSYGLNLIKIFKTKVEPKLGEFVKKAFSEKYLLYSNVVISISLSGVGDILEQKYEIYNKQIHSLDTLRTRNMCVSGLSVGVICHYWYKILDKHFPGYTLRTVVKKIFVDQVICSPVCLSTIFLTLGYMEGLTGKELLEEVKEKAWKLYVAEWVIWPPAQFINFYLLPTKYRVLYDNLVSLGYDVYTSKVKHTSKRQPTSGNEQLINTQFDQPKR